MIRFVKRQRWDFPEHEPDDELAEAIEIVDIQLYEEAVERNERFFPDGVVVKDSSGFRISRSEVGRRIRMYG